MITSFNEFVNENENTNEAITFADIRDKYEDNPYGIGANSVEFIEGKFGNSNILVFRHDNKYDRDKLADKLKSMGISPKKITKTNASPSFAYRYEVNLFESVDEELNESGVIKIGNTIADDLKGFLTGTVIPKSKGYVKSERDAAALLLDVIKNRYNF
jgi:hypothetical protein